MHQDQPQLSIVFLNFNRLPETQRTVEALRALTAGNPDYEVIAVDNASHDGTGEYLATQRGWMQAILLPDNTGIAGYNHGFKQARGRYILVLDDDSHPKDGATLHGIIEYLDAHPAVGVVACRIESPTGRTVTTWHLPDAAEQIAPSMAFVGCGFAIRREVFAQAGWYPEPFFLYQNELEVAIQVRRQGFYIHYLPDCRVVHRESPANRHSWRRVYFPTRNTIWIIRSHFSSWSAGYLIFSRVCIGLVRAVQSRQLGWYWQAVREALFTPVPNQPLSAPLRREFARFIRQNSLFHHLMGRA